MTVRGSGERALDLCTGNGIQAILLAAHAKSVVATDVNARALAYADFNVALNGAGNVETRLGSFFEPVDGEQFDLVVANPPYVVSPESAFLFRDGGLRGDAVSEHVVRRAPAVARARRVRVADDRLGARSRRPDGAPARLARGLGLRRVPAPHGDRRSDRDRGRVEPRARRSAGRVRRRDRPLARVLPRARDRAARLCVPRAAQARGRTRRLVRDAGATARRAASGGTARAAALRDSRPARGGRRVARPAAARRRRRGRHAGDAVRGRRAGSRRA